MHGHACERTHQVRITKVLMTGAAHQRRADAALRTERAVRRKRVSEGKTVTPFEHARCAEFGAHSPPTLVRPAEPFDSRSGRAPSDWRAAVGAGGPGARAPGG